MEMLGSVEDFGIDKITVILNDMHHSIENQSRSIYVTLPRKLGANECKPHWTTSLINHLTTSWPEFQGIEDVAKLDPKVNKKVVTELKTLEPGVPYSRSERLSKELYKYVIPKV